MGGLEAVMTGIQDEVKFFMARWRYSREIFTALICLSAFLFAIPNITPVSNTSTCYINHFYVHSLDINVYFY